MAIELYWDDDERRDVLLMEIDGVWTWEELFDALRRVRKVTDAAPTTVGALLDVSRGVGVPGGSIFNQTALDHARELLRMGAGRAGPIVIVGAGAMLRMVFSTFQTLDRQALATVRFAGTLDEGRALLHAALRGGSQPGEA